MAHQVLARKWRPRSFDQLVGQSHVLQALGNALDQGRLHHAYLFSGTRGVGKTTIARILARCFNCEKGVSASPCGECSACNEVSEGRSIDLIEVDAASRTKVDDTRELLENVQFAPAHSRYKIYLIDEVHMLSNSSFNALLKTLEEPPPHVVFLLATTHPQKIPATVLSRCLQFHLKNMPVEDIVSHLEHVLAEEQISSEKSALAAIARAATGSMRDALSLTEQAIAFGNDSITEAIVSEMLGVVDQQLLANLLDAIIHEQSKIALSLVQDYALQAVDFTLMVDELLLFLHRIAVEQVVSGAGAENYSAPESVVHYATQISPEDIQLYYQTVLSSKKDMVYAPDPLTGLEMMVLRMLAFRRMVSQSLEQLDSGAPPTKKYREDSIDAESVAVLKPEPEQYQQIESTVEQQVVENETPDADLQDTPVEDASLPAVGERQISDLNQQTWCEIFSTLPLSGVVRAVTAHCVLLDVTEGDVIAMGLGLLTADAMLYKSDYAERIAEGMGIFYGQKFSVKVSLLESWSDADVPDTIETPAIFKERKQGERHRSAIASLKNDENVQALLKTFDGELNLDSVQPKSS